jgi:hypothetical protein
MNKMFVIVPAILILAGFIAMATFNISTKAATPDGSCGGNCNKTSSCGINGCKAATTGTCGCQKTSCQCGCDGSCGGNCGIEGCACSK